MISVDRPILPMRPVVWYYVGGRRLFATNISVKIRQSWKVGRYPARPYFKPIGGEE